MDEIYTGAIKPQVPFQEENKYDYTYASHGERFINLIMDNIVINLIMFFSSARVFGEYLTINISNGGIHVSSKQSTLAFAVCIICYLLYYTLSEKLFSGYTLGKFISGTRAIRQDGEELTWKDAIRRSLVRIVPFEIFSGFNSLPWHDEWTKTIVVRAR